MMNCDTAGPLLPLYLDGELDRETVTALEHHVDGCPECAYELTRLDELRQAVRRQAPRYRAPDSLRASLQASARRTDTVARPPQRRPQWMAMAASVACAMLVSYATAVWVVSPGGAPATSRELVAHDLFASHLRALAAASPVDVVSEDRHTVKPWFAGRIGVAPPVPDFAASGFELVGGRIDYVGGQRVATVVYRHGKHLIDVYFLPPSTPAPSDTRNQGYVLVRASVQGQPAWIVSDMDARELQSFARLLART